MQDMVSLSKFKIRRGPSTEGSMVRKGPMKVFSDPADLDMLDKLGNKNNNSEDSALARQSLYVKFDPLVKGPNLDKNKNLRNPKKSVTDGVDGDENLMLMSSPHPEKQQAQLARQAITKETKVKDTVQDVDKNWSFDNQDMDGMMTSSMVGSTDMMESREQVIKPMMTSSWLETVKNYSELEGDSAIFSQDSVECLNWNTQDTGRAESPLCFDHEEVLHIDSSIEVDTSQDQSTDSKRNSKLSFPDTVESPDLKYSQADLDKWKKEIELDFQAKLLSKEHEWQKELDSYKHKNRSLLSSVKEAEKVIKQYDLVLEKVVESGEKKLSEQKTITAKLGAEYDKAQTDLDSFENAYSDICHRYEQLKLITDTLKKNETTLKTIIEQYKVKVGVQEEKYELLKKHAEEKLYEVKDQLERSNKTNQNEITLLKAALKRAEVKTDSLEQQIEQKVKENRELTSICDDLLKAQSASKK